MNTQVCNCFESNKTPHFLICLFFFIFCFTIYFNSLNNDFVFDDNLFIIKNESIKKLSLTKFFMTDIADSLHYDAGSLNRYYRPLLALSYAVDYYIWKLNPYGYRALNISIHATNSFLLYLLIYLMFKDSLLALLSAILFSVHPVHVSLAAFISGRSHGLGIFFMLLSLSAFVKCVTQDRQVFCILSALSFMLAILSYEGALLLPLFILVCAFLLNIRKNKIIIYSILFRPQPYQRLIL